jgi:peptidoglycan/xylan/chitin deacetylase (PgdA/CDA1 family)
MKRSRPAVREKGARLPFVALFLAALLVIVQGCTSSGAGASASKSESLKNGGPTTAADFKDMDESTRMQDVPAFDPEKPAVIRRGNKDRKMVALTIDDGWNRDDRILDLLEEYSIACTVFLIGGRGVAEADPAWIERMDSDGFEVCTHTYSHYKLTNRPEAWVAEDISKGLDVIAQVTGRRYPYMRPPGGFYDDVVIRAAAENGCYLVLWTSEFGDANQNVTADQEVKAVLSNLCNGDIILCHFGGQHTYEALRRLIPEILDRGYEFGTLSQVIAP